MRSFKRPNFDPSTMPPWRHADGYVWAQHKRSDLAHLVRKDPNPRPDWMTVKQWKRVRRALRHAQNRKVAA